MNTPETLARGIAAVLDHPIAGAALRLTTCLLVLVFFQIGYRWGYTGHRGPGVFDATLALDQMLPLVPQFIVFYMFGYVFVLVPCLAVRQRHDFYAATVSFCMMLGVAFLMFHFMPVHMQKTMPLGDAWYARWTRFQQNVDTYYNNFPSLHVALNVFAYSLLARQARRLSWWWLPVPVLVIVSTLLVKQHLVLDVIGGIVLAAAGLVFFRFLRTRSPSIVLGAFAVCFSSLLFLLLSHLERLQMTWRKIIRFVDAGGAAAEVVGAGLVALLLIAWLSGRSARQID
ncbi:MAG: phosphatase PAP2 family protein [Gammaproteobacteria bacterium]